MTNAKLAPNSVDTNKILDGQIFSQDIQDGAVTGADLAFNTVGAEDIADNSVGASELQGVTVLGFGDCGIDPPDIGGTDEAGQGRAVIATTCALPAGATRVIAYPYTTNLAPGLVPCGSIVSGGGNLWVCLQNVFDQTNVNDSARTWAWIAYAPGGG